MEEKVRMKNQRVRHDRLVGNALGDGGDSSNCEKPLGEVRV